MTNSIGRWTLSQFVACSTHNCVLKNKDMPTHTPNDDAAITTGDSSLTSSGLKSPHFADGTEEYKKEHDPTGIYPRCCRYHTVLSSRKSQQSLRSARDGEDDQHADDA
ncbi:hypothetical protein BDR26DRAFT_1008800 [Obelidium mucronatum]|nr:hypothetical protein BDR26DRAFT_1008800 [Obelidium mucronatum]